MLAFLAAVIPIIGALYVAGSYLIAHLEVAREWRVRRRYMRLRQERWDLELPVAKARAERMGRPFDMDVFIHELNEWQERMLGYHGVGRGPSNREVQLAVSMSSPKMPVAEIRRQWVLLLSSAAGLILLAVDQM